MIKHLKDISRSDINEVGGKAINLAFLSQNGIDVPDAFVISASVYDEYVTQNNIQDKIDSILQSNNELDYKSKEIKELFIIDYFNNNLREQIMSALDDINTETVAVRSSATVEDLPGVSFAGQYSSFLNVKKEYVLQYVLECYRSLWNERAIDYRKRNHIDQSFSHCVIVQEMVEAEVSGVMFTANPITGIRNEIVVNSAYGLGEAIVSGKVNPDQYTVNKISKDILKKELAKKDLMAEYSQEGIVFNLVKEDLREASSLNDQQIDQLIDMGKNIEQLYDEAQDIEFSYNKNGDLKILQTREITTLYPLDNLDVDHILRPYLVSSSVLLAMKEPFKPLGADLYGGMFPKVISVITGKDVPDTFVKYDGGRILLDISYMTSSKFVAKQFGSAFSGSDLPLKAVFNKMLDEHGHQLTHQGIKFKIPWGAMKYTLSFISKMNTARKVAPENRYDAVKRIGNEFYNSRKALVDNIKTIEDAWNFCEETMLEVFRLTQTQGLYCTEVGQYIGIENKIKKLFGEKFNLDVLGYALPDCYTLDMSLEMNRIAKHLVDHNEELTIDHPKVQEFLKVYGVRANVELDVGYERWRENPDFILNQIKSFMDDNLYARNLKGHKEKLNEVEDFLKNLHDAMEDKKGKRAADRLIKKLRAYRRAAGMREYPKFNIVQGIDLMRQVLIKQGQIMVSKGYIDEATDIFFLNKYQIREENDLRSYIKAAKAVYSREMKRNSIPRIVMNTGQTYYSAFNFDKNAKVISGLPLSSGIYEGRIRVVHDPGNTELREGEIMVAESTNPSWTPLFMKAKGLIMEYGGPLSHGGIVAREYGIPAVVGITSVTSLLKTGQMVRIDGGSGQIEILKD